MQPQPIVRPYVESDRDALRALFVRAGEGSPTGALWGHAESERAIYLTPYMELEPASLFVAELEGQLVGYLAGSLDSSAFPSEDERMERAIREHRLLLRPSAVRFFARAMADTARAKVRREAGGAGELVDPRWPAHLHINVAREARGTGAAQELMRQWFERLDAAAVGCYLQTLAENVRAVRFFEGVGFRAHGARPPVPGIRFEGRRMHQLTMVRDAAGGAGPQG